MQKTWLALALVVLWTSNVAAQGIYKWVDEQGQVHYGERPAGNANSSEVHIREAPTPDPVVQDRLDQQRKLLNVMQEDRAKKQESEAQAAKDAEQRKKACALARDRVSFLQGAGRLYNKDKETGTRHFYDEKERAQKVKEAEAEVKRHCK